MKVPFTAEEFFDVFKSYNLFVWPMQIVLYILALALILLAIKKISVSDRLISLGLGFFWLWMGIVYHFGFFSAINKAAYVFATLFIVQGLLFIYKGIIKKQLSFGYGGGMSGITGSLLMLYALVIYPALGFLQGRVYPSTPTFGLPCPTTIFTFGLLLWSNKKFPFSLLAIPLLWSIIGMSAAIKLGVKEDIGLIISAVVAAVVIRSKKQSL